MRTLAVIAVLVAVVAVQVIAQHGGSSAPGSAPALPAAVLAPPGATLASLRGQPAVVHFWASWCEPCVREAQQFSAAAAQLQGRARVVGVDVSDPRSEALLFLRRHRWQFSVLSDGDGSAGRRYRVVGLPTTFVLDSRGRIVRTLTGPQPATSVVAATAAAH